MPIQGTNGNDTLVGTDLEDVILGLAGDDTISGRGGHNVLVGGAGADVLNGGNDVDFIYSDNWDPEGYFPFHPLLSDHYRLPVLDHGTEIDRVSAGLGWDVVSIGYGDFADGGFQESWESADELILSLFAAPSGLSIDFRNTLDLTIGGGTITGFEFIRYLEGTQFDDVFIFSAEPFPLPGQAPSGGGTEISGLAGNDRITAGYYTSSIWGGDGDDVLDGQASWHLFYLSGGAGNDTLIASGSFSVTAEGGDGADLLVAGAKTDSLSGGLGNDTFMGSEAQLNGDTITDFAWGDKIVISDASLAGFTFSLSGQTLSYTGGSLTLGSVPAGRISASALAGGGVQLGLDAVQNDFNGDGRADILWKGKDGQLTNWLANANGGFVANSANAYSVIASSWHVAETGDFNADGQTDLLWRNDNGAVTAWLANDKGGFAASTTFSTTVPTAWQIVGTGDFNGDARDDILWRNSNGTITDWLSNASDGFTASTTFSTYVPTNWLVVGTGDFNGDGRDDILWRNDAGQLTDWLRTADGGFASNVFSVYVPTNWTVVATGDFNGDGKSDVLWREANGQLTDWLGSESGALVNNGANASTFVPPNWQVAAVGDFNGDARDDILWRNETGHMTSWLGTASGGFTDNSVNASTFVSTDWQVQNLFG